LSRPAGGGCRRTRPGPRPPARPHRQRVTVVRLRCFHSEPVALRWTCPRRSPGWWTRPAARPALTASSPISAAGCSPTARCSFAAAGWPRGCPRRPPPRRPGLGRAATGTVIGALAFAGAPPAPTGRDWLAELGPVEQHAAGWAPDSPVLGWAVTRPLRPAES